MYLRLVGYNVVIVSGYLFVLHTIDDNRVLCIRVANRDTLDKGFQGTTLLYK